MSSLPSSATARDAEADLARLLTEHRPRLVAVVSRRLDPTLAGRIDAEDVVNDAYLRTCSRWQEVWERADFRAFPWLYQLVKDCLVEAWRHETRNCRDLRAQMPWPAGWPAWPGLLLPGGGSVRRCSHCTLLQCNAGRVVWPQTLQRATTPP